MIVCASVAALSGADAAVIVAAITAAQTIVLEVFRIRGQRRARRQRLR